MKHKKRHPSHPGEVLRDCLPDTGLTQTELANRLGVSRRTLSAVLHERRAVTVDLALRLARVFNTAPDLWLNLQRAVDLWETVEENKREYERIKPLSEEAA